MRRDAKARHRDMAEKLGISEGALIAAHAGISDESADATLRATRLRPQWPEIIESLEPLGEVMALTRNASCVHEKVGIYRQASHNGHVGLVLGGEIDLRIFYTHWAHGFAVNETTDKGQQQSLQFFDAAGTAIHKIFLKPQGNAQAYADMVERFADENQQAEQIAGATAEVVAEQPDDAIDVAGFRAAWSGLRDTHDFFGVLKKFGVSRTQGLRLADPLYAQRVEGGSVHQIINAAAREGVSIMVFVGNPGVIQIHSGVVRKVAVMGPWINVLDPGFNLHLREDHIASAWVVKKPTVDGLVTSLEVFDSHGDAIAMLFGERKPGKPELCEWRALIEDLLKESSPCAA
jgi:putative hemin transport protein